VKFELKVWFEKSEQKLTFNFDDCGGLIAASAVGGNANVNAAVLGTSIENSQNASSLTSVGFELSSILLMFQVVSSSSSD